MRTARFFVLRGSPPRARRVARVATMRPCPSPPPCTDRTAYVSLMTSHTTSIGPSTFMARNGSFGSSLSARHSKQVQLRRESPVAVVAKPSAPSRCGQAQGTHGTLFAACWWCCVCQKKTRSVMTVDLIWVQNCLSTDATSKCHVTRQNCDSFRMNGAAIGIFKEVNKNHFSCLLKGKHSK